MHVISLLAEFSQCKIPWNTNIFPYVGTTADTILLTSSRRIHILLQSPQEQEHPAIESVTPSYFFCIFTSSFATPLFLHPLTAESLGFFPISVAIKQS